MSTPTVTPADSVPAPQTDLAIPSGSAYDTWRKTGDLPTEETPATETPNSEVQDPPSSEDSAPSTPVKSADSDTAPPQKKSKPTAEDRKEQLNTEIRDLIKKRDELLKTAAPPSVTPTSQPAAEPKVSAEPTLEDKDEKGALKYTTWEQYQAAVRQFDREQILKEVEDRTVKSQKTQKLQEAEQIIGKVWQERVKEARERYTDFDIALSPDLPIPQGSVTDALVLDSEYGPDVLYSLAKNPDELKRITALNPIKQARELVIHELLNGLLEKLSSDPRFEGKIVKSSIPPAKPVTKAPPPPHQVGGKGTIMADEVEQALKEDDFAAFQAAENRRELNARKGK